MGTDNNWELNMIQGISIEQTGFPNQSIAPVSDAKGNDVIQQLKIQEMLQQGVIETAIETKHMFGTLTY